MVELTRLNDTKISINLFLVEYVEETPDTIVVFQSGHKMVVKEKAEEIRRRFQEYLGGAMQTVAIKKNS